MVVIIYYPIVYPGSAASPQPPIRYISAYTSVKTRQSDFIATY